MRIDIRTHIGEGGFTLAQLALAVNSNATDDVIELHVTSPGGDVREAEAIYSALLNYKKKDKRIKAYLSGVVASAATYMVMAADEIIAHPNVQFMIHNAWMGVQGNKEQLIEAAEFLEGIDKGIAAIYLTRTKASADVITEMMKVETWLSASNALELGFIDSISDELEAVNAERKAFAFYTKEPLNQKQMDILEQVNKGLALLNMKVAKIQAAVNNMVEETLADGRVVYIDTTDGDYTEKSAMVMNEEGEMVSLEPGTYQLNGGRQIVVNDAGIITAVEESTENALKAENEQLKTELATALEAIEGLSAKVDALLKATPAGPKPTATRTVGSPKASVQAPAAQSGQKTFSLKELAAKTMGRSVAEIEEMQNLKGTKK